MTKRKERWKNHPKSALFKGHLPLPVFKPKSWLNTCEITWAEKVRICVTYMPRTMNNAYFRLPNSIFTLHFSSSIVGERVVINLACGN